MASSTPRENRSFFLVHTNSISKVCVFVFIQNAPIDSRPHYRFGAFSTVGTETFENKRLARCDVCWTLSCRRIPTASDKDCWDTSTQRCFFTSGPSPGPPNVGYRIKLYLILQTNIGRARKWQIVLKISIETVPVTLSSCICSRDSPLWVPI